MNNLRWIFAGIFSLSSLLYAASPHSSELAGRGVNRKQPHVPPAPPEPPPSPWFLGSLIAPPGTVTPYGHFEIEAYVYVTANTGTYSPHWRAHSSPQIFYSVNPQIFSLFGLTDWMDIQIIPQLLWNFTDGKDSVHFGDLSVGFDFQLYPSGASWFPGIKFAIKETFPTGKYQRLDPDKLGTDESGAGTFGTNFGFLLYKTVHLGGHHFLSLTFFGSCTLNTPLQVHGFNAYGGGFGTNGKALPGNIYQGIFSFEYSFNQNWAFTMDSVYIRTDKTEFLGTIGSASSGAAASVGGPSSDQISFAPGLEYSFSSSFGIEAGVWFTAFGRNSTEFRSGVINFEYNY